jgi:hypothetical protein
MFSVNDLYIKKINWPSDDKQELIQLIKAKFSAYGLVHSVRADKSVKAQGKCSNLLSPISEEFISTLPFDYFKKTVKCMSFIFDCQISAS